MKKNLIGPGMVFDENNYFIFYSFFVFVVFKFIKYQSVYKRNINNKSEDDVIDLEKDPKTKEYKPKD